MAHQEINNMSKIDLSVGCLKALVDSQKRVIEGSKSDIMKNLISQQLLAAKKLLIREKSPKKDSN